MRNQFYEFQVEARQHNSREDLLLDLNRRSSVWDRLLLKWLPRNKDAKILEVACGSGLLLVWLERHGYRNLEGIDASLEQVTVAKSLGQKVQLSDVFEFLGESENKYDIIFALDFYEHLTPDDFISFLHQSNTRLNEGGVIIMRGPNGDSPFVGRALFNDITHEFALTTNAFKQCLSMVGFKNIVFDEDINYRSSAKGGALILFRKLFTSVFRVIIRLIVGEDIKYFSPSIYVMAQKK
jgi:2-polyprenyl-3-methyl-5-hydroxy-6-metoxy-1,4-benzoquinol methylase